TRNARKAGCERQHDRAEDLQYASSVGVFRRAPHVRRHWWRRREHRFDLLLVELAGPLDETQQRLLPQPFAPELKVAARDQDRRERDPERGGPNADDHGRYLYRIKPCADRTLS